MDGRCCGAQPLSRDARTREDGGWRAERQRWRSGMRTLTVADEQQSGRMEGGRCEDEA